MKTCFCGRAARGFAYADPEKSAAHQVHCCSMQCMHIAHNRRGNMTLKTPLNETEKQAAAAASEAVGAYLERIGKTDLATMTEAEWLGFVGHAYGCVGEAVKAIWEKDCPF